MQILDRYILIRVLQPFLYCVLGFVSIWLVFDLSENAPTFLENKAPLSRVAEFYLLRVPEIILLSLPVGLLLAILYTFTQMSRRNELISILCAGRSVLRLLAPLLILGLLLTAFATALNYSAAPHAGAVKKDILQEVSSGQDLERQAIKGHLFRNREDRRFWHIGRLNPSLERLGSVMILQEDESGGLQRNYYAEQAAYDHASKTWRLEKGKVVDFSPQGDVKEQRWFEVLRLRNFSETPWRISSSVLDANFLSVPELREYLTNNSHFHPGATRPLPHPTGLPLGLALGLLPRCSPRRTPRHHLLATRPARRHHHRYPAFLFLILTSSVFLALGKGHRIDAPLAAWGPMALFAAIGLCMLWMRSTNREIPSILS